MSSFVAAPPSALPRLDVPQTVLDLLSRREIDLLHRATASSHDAAERWSFISKHVLTPDHEWEVHKSIYDANYKDCIVAPAWVPQEVDKKLSNIGLVMKAKGFHRYQDFYEWSINHPEEYWDTIIKRVHLCFDTPYTKVFDLSNGVKDVKYFPGAKLNIAKSCFNKRAAEDVAIISGSDFGPDIHTLTFAELNALSNKVANSLLDTSHGLGLSFGDAVGICMPMSPEAVAIYLGIVKAGLAVVSIADSFSPQEIETRMRLGGAKAIFTQDVVYRKDRVLPLFTRVLEAHPSKIVVLPGKGAEVHRSASAAIRAGVDKDWASFLDHASEEFEAVSCSPDHLCNVLFSSGTTGEPKAIPWSHATPVKCAVDGYMHQDIRIGEVVAWPTNIGWMMGPWLIFQLMNGASLALFSGLSSNHDFCKFIADARVNMLGVVPSMVKAWQASNATAGCDWSNIRRFSSTGEASDPQNMLWLMSRAHYAPVIEYCGGTEIAGSFLSSTVVQPNVPSMFSTPVLGSNLIIMDENGEKTRQGEIALIPPALGLSTRLLNRDHHECYYDGMPVGPDGVTLRRHGDEVEAVSDGVSTYYRAHGRCDDTMNLGGIKVSSIEIERVCNTTTGVHETAAVALNPPLGGPSFLVLFVVLKPGYEETATLKSELQYSIKTLLNPLFHVTDVVVVDSLPRTASNKIMRRILRDQFSKYKVELLPKDLRSKLSSKEVQILSSIEGHRDPRDRWNSISRHLLTPEHDWEIHHTLYTNNYKDQILAPAWIPQDMDKKTSNIGRILKMKGLSSYNDLYNWSISNPQEYFDMVVKKVGVTFDEPYSQPFDLSNGVKDVKYFPGAKLNIAKSCFNKRAEDDVAIISGSDFGPDIHTLTFAELNALSNKVANSLLDTSHGLGLSFGDAVGICMPMSPEAVAIYLGIVKAGLAVVSIADSFSPQEIETRMRLGGAKAIFTQDVVYRKDRVLPLFTRVLEAHPSKIVVLPGKGAEVHRSASAAIRAGVDKDWASFLDHASEEFEAVSCSPDHLCNVLFSSGTTGEPKAIPWSHATPVKCAVDGYMHQDIRIGEVVAWPTNIGWMMGPWLIFQLMNGASLALFSGLSSNHDFCKFIADARVNMLGVVPSMVKAWQASNATAGCDWSNIRRFSSTGEASDPQNMLWLMSRAHYAPVIEYCGGTEIAGSFLSSTVVQPNVPSMFSTPVLGSNLIIMDENGEKTRQGEIALIPPALGLSTRLLNRDHHECYYDGMPVGPDGVTLRRHGDEVEAVSDGVSTYYRAHGRCDDTMNLGGIKVSSIEIERVCNTTTGVHETAAVALNPPLGGPSFLVLFVVLKPGYEETATLKSELQYSIKTLLNPLFHVTDVVVVDSLPRTASNKIMRRILRDQYKAAHNH
jgi:acetyl-CoA synthetase